jgi:hypothetical protein
MRRLLLASLLVLFSLTAAAPPPQNLSAPCSLAYGTSPPEPLPGWLQTNVTVETLATRNTYELLAGQLLRTGIVDGAQCPSYGMNADGSPNACGLETAKEEIIRWQNRYDPAIVAAANLHHLPAKALKAVIAVESQFWPAASWEKGEIGLGQMTQAGADMLLAWQPAYFQTVCAQGFDKQTCAKGYDSLDLKSQQMIRGLVLRSLDATCPTCKGSVDSAKGEQAVAVLAEAIGASCQQSNRTFWLATGKQPAALLSYEDFWRLTLANYHVGAGCIYEALRQTGNPGSWSAIAINFPAGCQSGAEYIRRIEEQMIP